MYALAAYVEGAKARREFGIRKRGGFITADSGTEEYCDAAIDGSCSKLLVLQLLRDVPGEAFVQVPACTMAYIQRCLHVIAQLDGNSPTPSRQGTRLPLYDLSYSGAPCLTSATRRVQALNEALEGRMRLTGELDVLSQFRDFFAQRELTSGTQVLLLWRTGEGVLEVKLCPSAGIDYKSV